MKFILAAALAAGFAPALATGLATTSALDLLCAGGASAGADWGAAFACAGGASAAGSGHRPRGFSG